MIADGVANESPTYTSTLAQEPPRVLENVR